MRFVPAFCERCNRRRERLALLLVPALASLGVSSHVAAQSRDVMFVLDGSNSMWGRIEGTEKIVVARDVLSQALSELPPDVRVGLTAYGHRREQACDDIEVLLPVGDHPRADVEQAIRSVRPRGMTPITGALERAADGLGAGTRPTHLVLVSDGRETCDGDPCALAGRLRERGLGVTVHVVGFDVTAEEQQQLQCIADAGGGRYAAARSAAELTAALGDIRQSVVREPALPLPARVPVDRSWPNWRMHSDDAVYEGRLSRYYRRGGDPMIQLINQDGVNVGLAFRGELSGERTVTYAMFAAGRRPVCELVGEEGSFRIAFEPTDDGMLSGTFAGMLGCPDSRAMPVSGSFYLEAPRGVRTESDDD